MDLFQTLLNEYLLLSVCRIMWCFKLDLSLNDTLQISQWTRSMMPCCFFKCIRKMRCCRNSSLQPSCVQWIGFVRRETFFTLLSSGFWSIFDFVSTLTVDFRWRFFGFADCDLFTTQPAAMSLGRYVGALLYSSSEWVGFIFKIPSSDSTQLLFSSVRTNLSIITTESRHTSGTLQWSDRCSSNSISPITITGRLQSVQFLWMKWLSKCSFRSKRVANNSRQIIQS